jgi:1-acyl-sn-glycerol-3-phosphate acyltransferase
MLYRSLRRVAAIALRWYYAEIVVQGREHVGDGPLLVVANHPNALIDPLMIGTALRRPVRLTAKATLFEHPLAGALLRAVGVVPLRRASDERGGGRPARPARNADAFRQVTRALHRGEAILVFPEGISHDDPSLAPLRSGVARMAIQAHDDGVAGLRILPIGLIYERKERPDSRVLVRIGESFGVGAPTTGATPPDVAALTAEIERRLRLVTLNFATADRAARAVRLAPLMAALGATPASVREPRALDADVARRVEHAMDALADAAAPLQDASDRLTTRLQLLQEEARRRGVRLDDARISTSLRDGARFVAREGPLVVLGAICLVLGSAMHWLPLRIARRLARRGLEGNASQDQPAMRTVLFGLASVTLWYLAQAALLTRLAGPLAALAWLFVIFSAAHLLRARGGRLRRALARARTFLALRADPTLQPELLARMDALLADLLAFERALLAQPMHGRASSSPAVPTR